MATKKKSSTSGGLSYDSIVKAQSGPQQTISYQSNGQTYTTTRPTSSGSSSSTTSSSGSPSSSSGGSFGFMDGSKYDASGKQIVAPGGKTVAPEVKGPVTTSDPARSKYASLLDSITKLQKSSEAALNNPYNDLLEDRRKQLATRRKSEISGIKTSYAQESNKQQKSQQREVGTQSMGLARIGGFDSMSGQAVLTNLQRVHGEEQQALQSKKDAAILAANTAYEDKDFALAEMQIKEAKAAEQQMYDRNKDMINLELAIRGEERADAQMELQQAQRLDSLRKDAQEFNYNNSVTAPFMTIDGTTVLRSETHEPISEEQFFAETGYTDWSQVPSGLIQTVQKPVGGLSKDNLIQGKDGWWDISSGVPKLVIPESPNLQVIGQRTNAYGETENIYGSYNVQKGGWEEVTAPSQMQSNQGSMPADGTNFGQCGEFVKTLVDLPTPNGRTGNEWEEKMSFVDKYGIKANQYSQVGASVGDVLYINTGKRYGHVETVIAVNGDKVTTKGANLDGNGTVYTREISLGDRSIYGAIRGTLKSDYQNGGSTVQRNAKMDKVVNDMIKDGAGGWGLTAKAIDDRFGPGAATAYDTELKNRFLLPDEAMKLAVSDKAPKNAEEWRRMRGEFMNYAAGTLKLDPTVAADVWDKTVAKPGEGDNSPAVQFLNQDYFRSIMSKEKLEENAKKKGLTIKAGLFGSRPDVDAYLNYVMDYVELQRKTGMSDKEILDAIKKK